MDSCLAANTDFAVLMSSARVLRPGYTRVSLPYFAHEEEVDYVAKAVLAIADHGWRLLPAYRHDPKTGEWRHKSRVRRSVRYSRQ
eukprot:scaffold335131_cov37-Prasinocladus_malaysianus.AAC.1